jgi:hypothetical protein
MYSTYLRLDLHVSATSREVIKAAQGRLMPYVWYCRKQRIPRHNYYRQMLEHHRRAQALYRAVMTGECNVAA